jgi:hypothetical protein
MSQGNQGGRYLAEDCGAFAPEAVPEKPQPSSIATAPLAETAVIHMTPERTIAFIRWMETLD